MKMMIAASKATLAFESILLLCLRMDAFLHRQVTSTCPTLSASTYRRQYIILKYVFNKNIIITRGNAASILVFIARVSARRYVNQAAFVFVFPGRPPGMPQRQASAGLRPAKPFSTAQASDPASRGVAANLAAIKITPKLIATTAVILRRIRMAEI